MVNCLFGLLHKLHGKLHYSAICAMGVNRVTTDHTNPIVWAGTPPLRCCSPIDEIRWSPSPSPLHYPCITPPQSSLLQVQPCPGFLPIFPTFARAPTLSTAPPSLASRSASGHRTGSQRWRSLLPSGHERSQSLGYPPTHPLSQPAVIPELGCRDGHVSREGQLSVPVPCQRLPVHTEQHI